MFKKSFSAETVDTLIGQYSVFNGDIESEGTIKIEGKLNGNVVSGSDVYISEPAVIKGNITARNIYLSGNIDGNITAKGILHLLSTSKLSGDIEVHSFVADEGSIFRGNCKMRDVTDAIDEKAADSDATFSAKSSRKFKKSTVLEED